MAGSLKKGKISKEDCQIQSDELYPTETFERVSSVGPTVTLTKTPDIWKTHSAVINARSSNNGVLSDATITAAISGINGASRSLYIEPGAWAIDDNLTIPSTIHLIIDNGAILTIASGKTLTINGPFDAGIYQVFSGAGSVSFGAGHVKEVYPQWWGAVGDDSTDNAVAFQSAIDALQGAIVEVPSGIYRLGSMITNDNSVLIEGAGRTTVLRITHSGAGIKLTNDAEADYDELTVNGLRNLIIDSTDETYPYTASSGILITECHFPHIENVSISFFTNGIEADTAVYFGTFIDIKVKECDNGIIFGEVGSCHDNTFLNCKILNTKSMAIELADGKANNFHFMGGEVENNYGGGVWNKGNRNVTFDNTWFENNNRDGNADTSEKYWDYFFDDQTGKANRLSELNSCYMAGDVKYEGGNLHCIKNTSISGEIVLDGTQIKFDNVLYDGSKVTLTNSPIFSFTDCYNTDFASGERYPLSTITARRVTFAVNDATPSVFGSSVFKTANTSLTTITNFDGGSEGQDITVECDDYYTVVSMTGANIKGNLYTDIHFQKNTVYRFKLINAIWRYEGSIGDHYGGKAQSVQILADEAYFRLRGARPGWGFAQIGDNEEYALFSYTSAGVVTLIENSTNVADSDSDGNFCIYDGGDHVRIKNRLAAEKVVHLTYFNYKS